MASVEFHRDHSFPNNELTVVEKDDTWAFKRNRTYYPTVNAIIDNIDFTNPAEGDLHEPMFPLENYDRAAIEHPEHVREYARRVGELTHVRVREWLTDYRSTHKRDEIQTKLLGPDTGTQAQIVATLRDYYPGRYIRDDLSKQAARDAQSLRSSVEEALRDLLGVDAVSEVRFQVVRCEHPLIANLLNAEHEHGEAGFGGRIDIILLHPETEEIIAVELKTSRRITNGARMQTVAQKHLDALNIDRAVAIRVGRDDYRIHDAKEWDERGLYNRFKAEAVTQFHRLNEQ
ncbi:hypothetical protein [Haloarcula litorea]|uniref:hypothetical protein n=1 Tax=Haloarcula litorea TaxID=3032579 RepID=UPI0023E7C658|nr:hypothetical protein [Halomicroarcula sp. GDY20]